MNFKLIGILPAIMGGASEILEAMNLKTAARVADLTGVIIDDLTSFKASNKTLCAAIEIAETILENLDQNQVGYDDDLAFNLKKIRESIDLDK